VPVLRLDADPQFDTDTDCVELVVSDGTAEAEPLKLPDALLNVVPDRETTALFVGVGPAELVAHAVPAPLFVGDPVPDLDTEPLLLPEFVTDRLMVALDDLEALTDPETDLDTNGDLLALPHEV
jgi:hypothetical protein